MQSASDLLKRQFKVNKPNKAWVSDTTFIGTREGWLYLAIIMDLYSRQVVGWAMGNSNNSKLIQRTLHMAIQRRKAPKGTVAHSDQGSTSASGEYQRPIKNYHFTCSMSRKGECLDNAVAESFFGSLKNELIYYEDYKSRSQARQSIFVYIEVFYNRKRRHAFLDYMALVEYEAKCVCN